MGICCTRPEFNPPGIHRKPIVRMCSSGNHFSNFADIGDTVVLFVDFGKHYKPLARSNQRHSLGGATAGLVWPDQRHHDTEHEQYEIKLAGLQAFLKKIKPKDEDCTSFRAQAKILVTDDVLRDPGGLVKFVVPYCNSEGEQVDYVTEKDDEYDRNHRVYNHPLWDELIIHNEDIRKDIRHRTSSRLVETTYGSVGRQRRSLRESATALPTDQVDAAAAKRTDQVDIAGTSASVEVLTTTDEHDPLLRPPRPERYWPDSWEMKCWRPCCDPIMRSRNCFARFLAMFFVAPLTNVTGLSLYYQLYLTEIFHLRFATKFGHYIFMPFIVMMMMTFFAQWRFDDGCYTLENTEVLVPNATAVVACFLFLWYTVWGLTQSTSCMGPFMILPLGVLYILANITFQTAVKNSSPDVNCTECWDYTSLPFFKYHVKYFNAFHLIKWYYNPLLWVIVLCFGQALSHIFEPKMPPRVNQTAHWMSCTDMFKKYGYPTSFVIFLSQAVFGTIDELLASPRLLPLQMLRLCFTLGYSPKEWEVLQILVKKSIQYGDPALDYIGTGGAEQLPEDSVIPDVSMSESGTTGEELNTSANIGYNIGKLKRHLEEMESVLTDEHRKILSDPRTLKYSTDDWLEHYIVVRHYVAKYELQVHAYGPFRTNKPEQKIHAQNDDKRMDLDFPIDRHKSFRNFLNQVRFHLWMMEDEMIAKRAVSACCAKEV